MDAWPDRRIFAVIAWCVSPELTARPNFAKVEVGMMAQKASHGFKQDEGVRQRAASSASELS
jgi:hypothetical protein